MQRVNGDLSRLEGIDCETRGFEGYQSVESHRALRSRRRAVVHQVLKVQQQKQQQQQHNRHQAYTTAIQKDDHEMAIAQSSRNESFLSQELAHQMGSKDELVAQMAWQEFFAELDDDDELPVESEVTSMEDNISNTGFLDMGDIMDLMELDDE
jgi:ribosome-binding protein aMBF1 (putative translation factor)